MTTGVPGLVSIGYEGRTAEELVAAVTAAGVDVVVDVRLTPLSRKPGLSKVRLGRRLGEAGVEYLHLRALGNPKENRQPFWEGDLETGISTFRSLMREPAPAAALDELAQIASHRRAGVLCFERDHHRCHRQVVIDEVRRRYRRTELAFV